MKRILLLALSFFFSCSDFLYDKERIVIDKPNPERPWTLMAYLNGDNNLESVILGNIAAMKRGMDKDRGFNLVVLIDRKAWNLGDSSILGGNFTNTRLYDIRYGKALRISGHSVFPEITGSTDSELDMGSAETLKRFIKFSKLYYPAEHYALVIGDHGSGIRDLDRSESSRSVSNDDTSGTTIAPADFTDTLTSDESVDLIGFDACYMGCIEMAYQLRPVAGRFSAQYMVASAPEEWSPGWNYEAILQRIDASGGYNSENDDTLGGYEKIYPSSDLAAEQLGNIIVEEFRDIPNIKDTVSGRHSMSLVRPDSAGYLKDKIDLLAAAINQAYPDITNCVSLIGSLRSKAIKYYSGTYLTTLMYPYVDINDLCRIIINEPSYNVLHPAAADVQTALEACIICSFAVTFSYPDFVPNMGGLSIFMPDGDTLIDFTETYVSSKWSNKTYWEFETWYHPYNRTEGTNGRLDWCQSIPDGQVDNWSELMDFSYDVSGVNDYNP